MFLTVAWIHSKLSTPIATLQLLSYICLKLDKVSWIYVAAAEVTESF